MVDKVWVCDDEGSERFPVFTRGNVGETFVEAVSPLTWSAYGPHAWDAGWRDAFCGIGLFTPDEFKPPGQPEIVCCFGGYVYINMSVTRVLAVRIPGMTVEAIDRTLFGDYPDVPPYRADPRDVNPARKRALFRADQRAMRAISWPKWRDPRREVSGGGAKAVRRGGVSSAGLKHATGSAGRV